MNQKTVMDTIFIVTAAVSAYGAEEISTFETLEIRRKIAAAHGCINSLAVAYQSEGSELKDGPPAAYVYRFIAANAISGDFVRTTAHGYRNFPWADDPFQSRLVVHKQGWTLFRSINRTCAFGSVESDAVLPHDTSNDLLFVATGIWPFKHRPTSEFLGESCVLGDVANLANGRWTRTTRTGRACILLETPGVRTWIDSNEGYVLAREFYDVDTGFLMQRVELDRHRLLGDCLWFPGRLVNTLFAIDDGDADDVRVLKSTELHVLSASLNDIDEDIFRFTPPEGTLQVFNAKPPEQLSAGGLIHLDDLLSWIKRMGQASSPSSQTVQISGYFRVAVCAWLLIIFGEALGWIWRKRRKHNRASEVSRHLHPVI